ncbi:hypothetical protein KP509_22G024800 [Ceratopteris richardii]|uniref:Uncharacterized protein n=1 Tax=Ceratopteris richardii TaxID=49495 RepID=A0A8T2S4E8_CERRI|nr:hypothetical protein KP509_22G024800 [Ceratopteris richardii]
MIEAFTGNSTMARRQMILLVSLLFAVCVAGNSVQIAPLVVKGRVFCDACRAGFFSKSSFYLPGAKVGVQCGLSMAGRQHVTAYAEGTTGPNGEFAIAVEGQHESEHCVALLLHSVHPTCNILSQGGAFAGVGLTRHAGLANDIINTGPFAFSPSHIPSACSAELAAARLDADTDGDGV